MALHRNYTGIEKSDGGDLMVDLVLRPAHIRRGQAKPWELQIRKHESLGETEYTHLCYVVDDIARDILNAGEAYWLFGQPDGWF